MLRWAANWVVLAVSFLIGFGFVAVLPPRSKVTRRSDAEELAILFCLMTVASPLARQYYFMCAPCWLRGWYGISAIRRR